MGMVDPTLPDAPETLAAWHCRARQPVSTPSNAFEISALSFQALVEELSDLLPILEHCGFLHLRQNQQEQAYEKLPEFARFPDVTMKIHGIGELIPRSFPLRYPTFDGTQASNHIDRAMQAFVALHLMLATDWLLSAGREGYSNIFSYLKACLSRYSTDQHAAVLAIAAERIFAL